MSASVPLTYRCYCVSLDVFIYLRRSLYTVDVGTSVLWISQYLDVVDICTLFDLISYPSEINEAGFQMIALRLSE